MKDIFELFAVLAFILILILWTVDTDNKISSLNEQVEILECQVGRLLHPGLVDEECKED